VRRIRDQTLIHTVHKQVQFFKSRLADQHFVAQHHSVFQLLTAQHLPGKGFRKPHGLKPTVGVFRHTLPNRFQAQALDNMWWQGSPNEPIGLVQYLRSDREPKGFRHFEINDKLDLWVHLHRDLPRVYPFENLIHQARRLTP
jgi:hypothetical protein